MSNGQRLQSSYTALLKEKPLPLKAREAHLFPGLNKALISIVIFCNHGCLAIFDDKEVIILNSTNWKTIMRGGRDPKSGLYTLLLQHNSLRTENSSLEELFAGNVYECKSKQQLIDYHHASYWSSTQST